jgi:methylated-DNA-[protein]-cysteine S-methyltransferase
MKKETFTQSCYNLLKKIPKGKVTTYKALASALNTKAYRAIGQILKRNPNPIKVPCHRVVKSSGEIGGYQGTNTKIKANLLKKEGIQISKGKIENLNTCLYKF